jgi:hypothetical protein
MSTEEKVDKLINKLIDEALAKSEKDNDDIKKRKPEPFRYLTDREEIKAELAQQTSVSIMKKSTSTKIVEDKLAILGLGDIDTIENVIRKHEASRKIR